MNLEERVEKNVKEIVKDIREYFRNQKDDWQKLPWLALQANGRGGYSSGYSQMYEYGLMIINEGVFVDLESGELVNPPWGFSLKENFDKIPLASEKAILPLAFNFNSYAAKKEIKYLEEVCKHEDNPFYLSEDNEYGEITSDEWRKILIEKYGLEKDKYVKRKLNDCL